MAAPPGTRPAQTRRSDFGRGKATAVNAALFAEYTRLATADPACRDLSVMQVQRAVRRFLAEGLAERDLIQYVVGYADPTGETAVRNVMRGAR